MKEKIWLNPEVKKAVLITFTLVSLLMVFALMTFNYFIGEFNKGLLDKNISVIGTLIKSHPELKDEIVSSFIREGSKDDIATGVAAAAEYGYTDKLPVTVMPLINRFRNTGMISIVLISFVYFVLFISIFLIGLRQFYRKIREASLAAEKIVEGDFKVKLDEESEGELSKLGHQFNRMSKQLELSLDQLKKEKILLKNIISDISHQLKTPLSSIKVFNDILLNERAKSKGDQVRFLEKSSEQIERMEWLIQNLLIMARIEAKAVEFHNENIPLLPTIEAAVDSLRAKWESKGQNVRVTGTCEIFLLHDERWLGEAIGNIVKNSIEHTPENGNIDIELSETPIFERIVIRDDGEGINSEDLPHIFQRFYKGKNNTYSNGTGIGLALAKAIIENEGGIISVNSVPGKGTIFTVTFAKGII